jgi:hypothetical protein
MTPHDRTFKVLNEPLPKLKKDEIDPVAYSMSYTGGNSEKYGGCECCDKPASNVYKLTQSRRYKHGTREGVSYYGCFTKYGHKKCLSALAV